jgi:hypothetical protein
MSTTEKMKAMRCDKCGTDTTEQEHSQAHCIEYLKAALSHAHKDVARIQGHLNTFRVKCPTCRCRILPGEVCRCCAEQPHTDDEPAI